MKLCLEHDAIKWDAYVARNPRAANYHQYGWRIVIEKSFGHETLYLSARDHNDDISGILPLVYIKSSLFGIFLVSLPFFNYGGLLCDNIESEDALLEEAKRLLHSRNAVFVELRHVKSCGQELATKRHKVTMLMNLTDDADRQWNMFDSKLRNQIRKAEKSGLNALVGGVELLDSFYNIFAINMRDLGTPIYSKRFFENILREFPKTTKIFIVVSGKKAIAAGLGTSFRNTFEMPWASSLIAYRGFCPNDFLYWTVIKYSIENRFKVFDFGRSTPGSGAYKFKEQWGTKSVELNWQYILREGESLPNISPDNPKYTMAINLWRRMPVWLTKMIGPGIVKYIP